MQFSYDGTCCSIIHCFIHTKTQESPHICRVIQGGIFFLVSGLIPPTFHKLLHVGCKLQAACFAESITAIPGRVFLPYSPFLFHVSSWVNSEGLHLQGGERRQPRKQGGFWAWQAKAISPFCMHSHGFIVCIGLAFQLQVFIIPRIMVWLTETSPCRQREGTSQIDAADGASFGSAHNTKGK